MVRVEAREEALGREFQADRTSANTRARTSMEWTASYGQFPQCRQAADTPKQGWWKVGMQRWAEEKA